MEKINYCMRCGHKWKQRGSDKPRNCPCCKNPNWNRRSAKEIIDYIVG
jgi:rubrerythrin